MLLEVDLDGSRDLDTGSADEIEGAVAAVRVGVASGRRRSSLGGSGEESDSESSVGMHYDYW